MFPYPLQKTMWHPQRRFYTYRWRGGWYWQKNYEDKRHGPYVSRTVAKLLAAVVLDSKREVFNETQEGFQTQGPGGR